MRQKRENACVCAGVVDQLQPADHQQRAALLWESGRFELWDGGSDEDGSTAADNTLFAVQGLFVP